MALNSVKSTICYLVLIFASISIISCKHGTEPEEENKVDSTQSNFIKIDRAIFSIPSPYQTAFLVKKLGIPFNKELCNQNTNLANYSTNFKKALNLGVYGADLGYVSIYEQNQEALNFLKAAQKLASEIGIGGAFDPKLIERFQKVLGQKDSMLSLSSDAFRAGNTYLQDNERKDIAGLVIAGGFIESLHITIGLLKQNQNIELLNRIGEQKTALDNLIRLLTPYYEQPEYTELVDQLIDLAYLFDAIEFKYTYVPPITDEDKKLTVINGKSEVIITPEQIKDISEKLNNIRTQIIG